MSNTPTSSAQVAEGLNQYRKKPVVIEAVQFTEAVRNAFLFDKQPLPVGMIAGQRHIHPGRREVYTADFFIETMEGRMLVALNDWIITGVKGEHYPCKPDIFAATYEAAATGADSLPPLPERPKSMVGRTMDYRDDDMREYALSAIAPYAERIRQLERELEARAKSDAGIAASGMQSIGGDRKFINRMNKYFDLCTATNFDVSIADIAWKNLVAYIDGRTAGSAGKEQSK